jgi:hypothetical protein
MYYSSDGSPRQKITRRSCLELAAVQQPLDAEKCTASCCLASRRLVSISIAAAPQCVVSGSSRLLKRAVWKLGSTRLHVKVEDNGALVLPIRGRRLDWKRPIKLCASWDGERSGK